MVSVSDSHVMAYKVFIVWGLDKHTDTERIGAKRQGGVTSECFRFRAVVSDNAVLR